MSELLYGFDSSLSHFGWAVMDGSGSHFVDCGVWVTKPAQKRKGVKKPAKTDDNRARNTYLAQQLVALTARYGRPALIVVEALALPPQTTRQTYSACGRVRGLVDMLAAVHAVEVREFQPQALKKHLTGRNDAEKSDVITAVKGLYPELVELFAQLAPADVEHAADAVAALHVALTQEHHHAEANEED